MGSALAVSEIIPYSVPFDAERDHLHVDPSADVPRAATRNQVRRDVWGALMTLAERDRRIVMDLMGFNGPELSYRQLSARYDVSVGTIHNIITRAFDALAAELRSAGVTTAAA